jgi:phosphoserine phosphatase
MTYVLTLVADRAATTLDAATIGRVREAVEGGPPELLSPGEAAEIPCATLPDLAKARSALEGRAIDAIAIPAESRRKKLLIADMDSTIVTGETLDELAIFAGVGAEVAAITRLSMNGEIDFTEALRRRVVMLKGLDLGALERTWRGVRLTPGARELIATMRAHGAFTALVSGGFTYFTARVAAQAGFDAHRANRLIDDGRALTGELGEPILDRDAKLTALREFAAAHEFPLSETLAVGDGANDLAMLRAAGIGIAYHAKPIVAGAARVRIDHADLRALLFIQGYRAGEFVGQG